MRKLIIIASILVLLIGGYTGFWFYQAAQIKKQVAEELAKFSEDSAFTGRKIDITYNDLQIGGYPLGYKLTFYQPKVMVKAGPESIELNMATASFTRSILPPYVYKINLGTEISNVHNVVGSPPFTSYIRYKEMPTLEFSINEIKKTGHFLYEDSGFERLDAPNGNVLSSTEKSLLSATSSEAEGEKLRVQIKMESRNNGPSDMPFAQPAYNTSIAKLWQEQKLGKNRFTMSLNIIGPNDLKKISGMPEISLDINEFVFTTEAFTISAQGNIESVASDLFPFGKVTLKLQNFSKLVDFIVGAVELSQQENINAGLLTPEQAWVPTDTAERTKFLESVNTFLRGIATPPNAESPDATIIFNREKGGNFYIGSLSAPEVLMLYQKLFVKQANSEGATPLIEPAPDFVAPPAY